MNPSQHHITQKLQADERNRTAEIQAASEPGHFRHRIVCSVRDVYLTDRASSGFQHSQLIVVPARRMRHRENIQHGKHFYEREYSLEPML